MSFWFKTIESYISHNRKDYIEKPPSYTRDSVVRPNTVYIPMIRLDGKHSVNNNEKHIYVFDKKNNIWKTL